MEGNQLLANRYRLDVNTGNIDYVDDLGGSGLNFYDVGYYTDGGSAFSLISQEVIEGANAINSFRFWASSLSTISAFHSPFSGLSGYFLERPGPGSNVKNSNLRIPEGEYNITPHWRTLYGGKYSLQNASLLGDRGGILIHTGYNPSNTEGCLLAGCGWSGGNALVKPEPHLTSTFKVNQINKAISTGQISKINIFNVYR